MLENDRTYIASPVLDDVERVGDDVQWAGSLIILDQNLEALAAVPRVDRQHPDAGSATWGLMSQDSRENHVFPEIDLWQWRQRVFTGGVPAPELIPRNLVAYAQVSSAEVGVAVTVITDFSYINRFKHERRMIGRNLVSGGNRKGKKGK
jgi:hypothetical protein